MYTSKDNDNSFFFAKMNAKVVKDAERYYRNMFTGVNTWNIRDKHMVETLANLINYYSNKLGTKAKAVVWAHNSHLGDASHTSMKARGEYNLGQLAREHFGMDKCFNIGFTTYNGTVTASHDWDEDPQFMLLNPGMEGSYEKLFHDAMPHMGQDFMNPIPYMLIFRSNNKNDPNKYLAKDDLRRELEHSRYERAIGVIYRPATEIFSHYFKACLPKQFDAVIHVETTLALSPLEIHPQWAKAQREHVPSAFPGLAHLKASDYEFEGFFDPSQFDFGPDFVNEMYHKDIIDKKSSA
jgi:erythromycin esterase-like protein